MSLKGNASKMKCSCFLTALLSLFISKVSGDVTPTFLYDVLSNRITVDGELLRNEIRDINSRIDTLFNTMNELTVLIKTGNGMDDGEVSVVKPVDETVAMKLQKYEKVVNKVLTDEKRFLRGEIKKLTEQMSKLMSENSMLRNTIEDNMSNLTNENSLLRNTIEDNMSNLTNENSLLRNKLDSVDDNVSNLTTVLITVDDNIYNLTSETSVLKNTLDILEESMLIKFEQNGNSNKKEMDNFKSSVTASVNSNKREMANFKSSITASVNVLKDKHVADLKISENKVLNRISGLQSGLDSTNYQMSRIQSREGDGNGIFSRYSHISGTFSQILYVSFSAVQSAEKRKISFTARLEGDPLINLPGGSTLILNKIPHNDGNGYSSTTGIFTCPNSGVYLFVYFVEAERRSGSSISKLNVQLMHNGVLQNQAISESFEKGQDVQGGSASVIHLYKGDRVWLETRKEVGIQSVHGYFTTFSGIILY